MADWLERKDASEDLITKAHAFAFAAEKKMGALLLETERAKGASAGGKKDSPRGPIVLPRDTAPTLTDLGLTKRQSAEAQLLAELPETDFARLQAGTATKPKLIKERTAAHKRQAMADAALSLSAAQARSLRDVCDLRHWFLHLQDLVDPLVIASDHL